MSLSPVELEAQRRSSPARKLAVMHAVIEQAWSIEAAMIRERPPDLGPDEVVRRARRAVAGGDPVHGRAPANRHTIRVDADAMSLAPVECVIVRKPDDFHASESDRHLRDIATTLP